MYKIGDYIRIINPNLSSYNKIGKIVCLNIKTCYVQFFNDFGKYYLKDITPYSVFKIGDEVKIMPNLKVRSRHYIPYLELDPRSETSIKEFMCKYSNYSFIIQSYHLDQLENSKWILFADYWWSPDLLIPIFSINQINIF